MRVAFPDTIVINGVELDASVEAYDGVNIPLVEYYGKVYTDADGDEFTYCIRVYTESTEKEIGWACDVVRTCPTKHGLLYTHFENPKSIVSALTKLIDELVIMDLMENAKGYEVKDDN